MHQQTHKPAQSRHLPAASQPTQKKEPFTPPSFTDNRPAAVAQQKLQAMANGSPIQQKTVVKNIGQWCNYGNPSSVKQVIVGRNMDAWLDPNDLTRGQAVGVNASQNDLMAWIKGIYPKAKGVKSVKGHLLNDNLGGTALNNNLYPISKGANGMHLSTAENYVKKAMWGTKKRAVNYSVRVAGATDYTGTKGNAKATFITSVRPWEDVNDTSKVGAVEYTANIVSDFGDPIKRTSFDMGGKANENIAATGLKPAIPPAKGALGLRSEESTLRNKQPGALDMEVKGGKITYNSSAPTATGTAPGDLEIMLKAKEMLNKTPGDFIDEHIDDSTRGMVEDIIAKHTKLVMAQQEVDSTTIMGELVDGLPDFVAEVAKKDSGLWWQIHDALLNFVQSEFEYYHEDDIDNDD